MKGQGGKGHRTGKGVGVVESFVTFLTLGQVIGEELLGLTYEPSQGSPGAPFGVKVKVASQSTPQGLQVEQGGGRWPQG